MTMNIYEMYETDLKTEVEGFWHTVSPERKDPKTGKKTPAVKFLLARAGGSNPEYQRVQENRMRPHRRAIKNDTFSMEMMQEIQKEIFCAVCVLDWSGVTDKSGKALVYSKTAVGRASPTRRSGSWPAYRV
jgi:hypothetical protein